MIRYVYRPYHPWRHGYRREKIWKIVVLAAKLLLAAECLYFSGRYLTAHTVYETFLEEAKDGKKAQDQERDVYGIGYEEGSDEFFWFHRRSFAESDRQSD